MMMNKSLEIYRSLLLELQTHKYDNSDYIHRKFTCDNSIGIVYSVSVKDGMRALEIPADKVSKKLDFPTWKGVNIDLVTIPEYSHPNQLYIELHQMPGTEPSIFEIVADDLRRGINCIEIQKSTTKYTIDRLKKWRDFFTAGKTPVLTGAKAQGLFGELLFLKDLINHYGSKAVNYWAGVFFARPFWRKLQIIFGECCISKLEKVADFQLTG